MTVSAVVPLLKHVNAKCTPTTESSTLTKEIQTTIWNDIGPRYKSPVVVNTLNIASFLDPRFKDHHLQDKKGILLSVKGECLVATPDVNDTESENSQSPAASPSATEYTNT